MWTFTSRRVSTLISSTVTAATSRVNPTSSCARPAWKRHFSPSASCAERKSKDPEVPPGSNIKAINNTGMTEQEIHHLFEEEEARMRREQEEKFVDDWKPGMRKRPLKQSIRLEDFVYELDPSKEKPWTLRDKRTGVLAIKVGMMPVFDEVWGQRFPCTVLYVDNNVVLGHKTPDKHGYTAVQIAAGERKRKNVGVSVLGQYQHILEEPDENPPYLVREFRLSDESLLPPVGSKIHASHFVAGQNIDASGISKGKGFQGGMKRHNFGGMPASHGVSRSHRALGSTGQCQDPGRVFKGKKMAGRMGGERVTTQNLRIVKIDRGRNLLYVHGAVPGNKGAFLELRDAVKKPLWRTDLVPVNRPPVPTFEFDETVDGSGESGHVVWMPLPTNDPLAPDQDEMAA